MNLSQSKTRLHEWVVTGVFCAFFFFYGLAAFGVVGADEPRYAQIAREMLARHDWVSPTLHGRVWLEKPILYYWSAMASYRLFGVSDWTARIPVALFATMMVTGLHLFMRRFRPGTQLQTALIACSAAAFFSFAHAASTDMPLAACFTLGMLAWLAWFKTQQKKWLAVFYFFMAAGMLAKGPIAPLLAALVIGCFALLCRNARLVLKTLWLPGVLVFLLTALPWYVLVQLRNPQFFKEFILRQNLARFGTNLYHHEEPFWYYLPVLLVGLFPWTVFSLAAWARVVPAFFRKSTGVKAEPAADDLQKFLAVWAVLPVVFFSLSQSKLPGYILPAIPAWVLLTILYFVRESTSGRRNYSLWIAHALTVAAAGAMILLAPTILLAPHQLHSLSLWKAPVLVAVILAGILTALAFWRGWQAIYVSTLCLAVAAAGLLLKTTAPVVDATKSARPAARYLANTGDPVAVFHVPRGIQYGLGFYFNQEIPSYDAGNFPEQEHFLLIKKYDVKELTPIMQERARQGTHGNCLGDGLLRLETSFQSPVFDLYRISARTSCDGAPLTEGVSVGK